MHIQEARWGMDWTDLAKDSDRWRIVAKAMNMGLGGGGGSRDFLARLRPVSFS
jgi:hypothetical protein